MATRWLATIAIALSLTGCGADEEQRSWTGAAEPTPLHDDWVSSTGDALRLLDVPFGTGSTYCVRTEVDNNGAEACTAVFWSEEELAPGEGMVSFLNASPLGPDRALFVAVVTADEVSIDLPCGRSEFESASLPGGAHALFGVAWTTGCPVELDFVFTGLGEQQTVGTTATA